MHNLINKTLKVFRVYLLWLSLLFLSFSVYSQKINALDQLFQNNINNTGSFYFQYQINEKSLMESSYNSGSKYISKQTELKISSASEVLAAAVILSLKDANKLELSDPISKYLPQFKGEMSKITILQLLTHTSGLPSNSVYLHDESLNLKYSVNNIASNLSINTLPGEEFSYGAVSYQILGRIAEVITDKSWQDIFAEKITSPCEMKNTYYEKSKSINIAEDVISNAADFEHFLNMLLNKGKFKGKTVLSEASVAEMLKDHTSKLPIGYAPYRYHKQKFSGYYALGLWIDRIREDGTVTELSVQGAKGFTAWLNTCNKSTAVFAMYGDLKYSQSLIATTRDYLVKNYANTCRDLSSKELANLKNKNSKSATYTNISFELYREASVNLKLFDPLGNQLQELIDGNLKKGNYNFPVDISELSSGVYFYRLKIDDKVETKKLTIRK